jgi:hypothetical protein
MLLNCIHRPDFLIDLFNNKKKSGRWIKSRSLFPRFNNHHQNPSESIILWFLTWRGHVPPKRPMTFNGPPGVVYVKTQLFKKTHDYLEISALMYKDTLQIIVVLRLAVSQREKSFIPWDTAAV